MSNFTPYLEKLAESKEIGLVIYEGEIGPKIKLIQELGYQSVPLDHVKESGKYFFAVTPENAKEIVDFITEYPTGQFSMLTNEGKRVWITPVYDMTAIVLFIEKDLLDILQQKGFDFLGLTGMTYQE